MLTLEQVQSMLGDRNLRYMSNVSGLTYNTVWRIKHGTTKSVSYESIKRLSDYLTNDSHGIKTEK